MLRVMNGGIQTLVEDWIGRPGYLDQGIGISGAMDHFAIRVANLVLGNDLNEAALEIPFGSFAAEFETETAIAVTGANLNPKLNGNPIPLWEAIRVNKGDTISFGRISASTLGCRAYLAILGGIDVPLFLGSKSTAVYGSFGGYKGRALKEGDELRLSNPGKNLRSIEGRKCRSDVIPEYDRKWEMRAIPGPNGAPDFFSEEGMEAFFTEEFKVQTRADRSGIRLTGPKPGWANVKGATGGHPSNIIDHGYAVPGTLNVSGDTPILLPREGPTSGGYVCALSVIYADQWILGQLVPGRDSVRFTYCTLDEAIQLRKAQDGVFTEEAISR